MPFRSQTALSARRVLVSIAVLLLAACVAASSDPVSQVGPIADPVAAIADSDWLLDGRDYSAQRYSPLTQINAANVSQLGLAWFDDLGTFRGVEATPVYADGVLYNTLPWNITIAYDARSGERLWTYDPKVDRARGRLACCEPVSRGLALWQDKIIIATLDGRLIALDKHSGQPIWSSQTFGFDYAYTITGAPRVYDGKVIIGNSGGDMGIRGFVSAWDVNTGAKLWKFFLTPGDPANGPDGEASDPIMEMIRQTWSEEGMWKELGGGGNPWDSISYDPENKLVFVGTGNGSPLSWYHRSHSEGDNLFVCSIVALNADDGSYAWHYQMVPEEDWDYTCSSSIVSADLMIDGRMRQTIMQAPKNGFYYVLDRKTGELISAKPYVKVNWTTGIDPETGRPQINPAAHFGTDPALVYPGSAGAHNWFPMAYSPRTKLAYFPAYEWGMVFALDPDWQPRPMRSNAGYGGYTGAALAKRRELAKEAAAIENAFLVAYDPVKQQIAWKVPLPRHGNGGAMVAASDLVFEGTTKQTFAAFDARTGEVLWEVPVQSAPVAGPITYQLDGEQYVAINAGWGGGAAQVEQGQGIELPRASARLLVFKLGGTKQLPPLAAKEPVSAPPIVRASEEQVNRGAVLYADTCAICHGNNARGGVADLRWMSPEVRAKFNQIVLEGLYLDKGMAGFSDIVSEQEAAAIYGYLVARANEDWAN